MNYEKENRDRPAWTLFFEGTLYRRYIRYLKNHDLSQMLNNGTTLTSSYRNAIQPPILTNETSWVPTYQYLSHDDESPPPYQSRLESISSKCSHQKLDHKKIQKRTKWLICLGITFIALAAAIVALAIHYIFINDKTERVTGRIYIPENSSNVTFAILKDNKDSNNDGTGKSISLGEKINSSTPSATILRHPGSGSFQNSILLPSILTKKPTLVLIPPTTKTEESTSIGS